MANKNGLLSDLQLKQWTKASKVLAKSDGNGLTFTVSAAGKAVWVLRYRFGGRRFELTLGPYPDLALAEARAMAAVKRADVLRGVNPVSEKHKAKAVAAKDWTLRQLINDYRTKKLAALAKSTQRSYGRHLKLLDRRLGTLTVREAEAGDIVALIEESKLTWVESNMMLVATKSVFTHACGKRLINANPCSGIMLTALLGPRPPIRHLRRWCVDGGEPVHRASPGHVFAKDGPGNHQLLKLVRALIDLSNLAIAVDFLDPVVRSIT